MTSRLYAPAFLAVALALTAPVQTWYAGWEGNRAADVNAMAMLLGDGRRIFANHFFVKADQYFHRGYYPTVFDNREAYATPHIAEDSGAREGANQGDEHAFMGPPSDWIQRFGRSFIPSEHLHLDAGTPEQDGHEEHADDEHAHSASCEHGHDDAEGGAAASGSGGGVGEMLPWLQLSVAMDPQRVDSYLVSAYWLSEEMGKPAEAERVLREGLSENPDSYELLFELGRLQLDEYHKPEQAHTIWSVALRKWQKSQAGLAEPDLLFQGRILSYLALAEERTGDIPAAIEHLTEAEVVTGNRGLYRERRDRLKGGLVE
jgi:tetratricopeptide (TPR) repeat protein